MDFYREKPKDNDYDEPHENDFDMLMSWRYRKLSKEKTMLQAMVEDTLEEADVLRELAEKYKATAVFQMLQADHTAQDYEVECITRVRKIGKPYKLETRICHLCKKEQNTWYNWSKHAPCQDCKSEDSKFHIMCEECFDSQECEDEDEEDGQGEVCPVIPLSPS